LLDPALAHYQMLFIGSYFFEKAVLAQLFVAAVDESAITHTARQR
jgi:hypothetical protein